MPALCRSSKASCSWCSMRNSYLSEWRVAATAFVVFVCTEQTETILGSLTVLNFSLSFLKVNLLLFSGNCAISARKLHFFSYLLFYSHIFNMLLTFLNHIYIFFFFCANTKEDTSSKFTQSFKLLKQ